MSPSGTGAKTWVSINAGALHKNIQSLASRLELGVAFMAVVKSNAYGHDLDTIARLCSVEGVNDFGVDSLEEAHKVRERVPNAEVYILGYTPAERFSEIVEHDFIQTIYRLDSLEALAKEAMRQQRAARVNIKIETGTNRQGLHVRDLEPLLIEFRRNERALSFYSVSSHFSDAENPAYPEYTANQHNAFCDALIAIHEAGFHPPMQHIACSAAAILYPETQFTATRFGIALYGLWSSEELRRKNRVSTRAIELMPVLSWKTRVAQIKNVAIGDSIGYSHGFTATKPMRIAILPVGYFDGFPRAYARGGSVIIRGQRCSIVGNICMNMCMVDISLLPQIKPDDTVTLLGRDGMHQITAEDIAEKIGTINYEVVASINPLLPRFVV